MANELVKAAGVNVPALTAGQPALPVMVERAGPAGRFAWEEFFYAETRKGTFRVFLAQITLILQLIIMADNGSRTVLIF
jgi:hypothetical protein